MRLKEIICSIILVVAFSSTQGQNQVLRFDGVNDMINLGGDAGNGVRSIELWFKPDSIIQSWNEERITLVTRNADDQTGEFGIYIGYDFLGEQGRVTFTRQIDSAFHYIYSDNNTWQADEWYHVSAVIDPTAGMLLYIDGILQTDTDPSVEPTSEQTEMTTLGCWGDKLNRWLEGSIDEVRFWDRALSYEEINENMCDTLDPNFTTGLTGYWRMDEGEGHTVKNYIDDMRDADIFGCTYVEDTLCFATKITKAKVEYLVSIIPNPVMDNALIIFPNDQQADGSLEIFDTMGKLIDKYQVPNTNFINISRKSYKDGIYFYILRVGQEKYTGKIIFN